MNPSHLKIGDTVISIRSWTHLTIHGIDHRSRMVWDRDNRAISFEEIL